MQATKLVSMARARRINLIIQYILMVLLAAFFLFPLVFMFVAALKDDASVLSDSGGIGAFIPDPWVGLDNFSSAAERASLWRVFFNSVIISTFIVGLGLVVNSLFGYALARLRFRGRYVLVASIVALIIIPFEALAVPLLFITAELGWLDTYHVQILPFVANPLFIYLEQRRDWTGWK
jgi:multiple sugar transport system permease protein